MRELHGSFVLLGLDKTGDIPIYSVTDVALQHQTVSPALSAGIEIRAQGPDGVFGSYVSQT